MRVGPLFSLPIFLGALLAAPALAQSRCDFNAEKTLFVLEPPLKGVRRTLKRVVVPFDAGTWQMGDAQRTNVGELARTTLADSGTSFFIVWGFTDTVGAAESNQVLSFCRAVDVANELMSAGVGIKNIRIWGSGETTEFLPVPTPNGVREAGNNVASIEVQ